MLHSLSPGFARREIMDTSIVVDTHFRIWLLEGSTPSVLVICVCNMLGLRMSCQEMLQRNVLVLYLKDCIAISGI